MRLISVVLNEPVLKAARLNSHASVFALCAPNIQLPRRQRTKST